MSQLLKQLLEDYQKNPEDVKFGDRALHAVEQHYKTSRKKAYEMKGAEPKLTSVHMFMIKLRKAVMALGHYHEKYGSDLQKLKEAFPNSPEVKAFENADMANKERIKRLYYKTAVREPVKVAIKMVRVVPPAIENIRISREQATALAVRGHEVQKKKAETPVEIQGNALMEKVFSNMNGDDKKYWVPGLLLATGRRLGEILLTAKFSPVKGTDYEAYFKGQMKTMDTDLPEYKIPLLAPLTVVQEVLGKVRAAFNTVGMTAEGVHDKYERNIVNWTKKLLGIVPHSLRSYYAVICEKLYNQNSAKRMEFTGYIAKILGHMNIGSAVMYQRVILKDTTHVWKPPKRAAQTEQELKEEKQVADQKGLVYSTVPEYKRMQVTLEMMKQRIPITASAMKRIGKGTIPLSHKFIEKNKAVIDAYNATF